MNFTSVFNVKWLVILFFFTAIVFTFTHIPQQVLPVLLQMNGLDKVLHALAYGIITFLFILSFRVSHNSMFNLIPLSTVLAFAAVDELTQNFVGRTASLYDWIADLAGIVFAQSIFLYHNRIQSRVPLNKSFLFTIDKRIFPLL